jgi:ubiquinone/menaquinone biosynthesis C-methylase UbiE
MSMNLIRSKLNTIYWWLEKHIDPLTRSSQYIYAELLRSRLTVGSSWLDVGCGRQVLPEWVTGQANLVATAKLAVGLDFTRKSLHGNQQLSCLVIGEIERAPFAADSFDIVSANMVVEHLDKPTNALLQIYRVLTLGGYFVYHTPNVRFYMTFIASLLPQSLKNLIIRLSEGRSDKDVFPTRYRMNTLQATYEIAENCGFRVVELHSVNSSSTSEMMFGPFVVLTLAIRRLLRWQRLRQFRSNFVVVLQKVE